jgi:glycosyltransferase involved in cell wall biosynthesis
VEVTVICPVFNTPPDYLREAVASVLAEPRDEVVQLILVDDASTRRDTIDALAEIAEADSRVMVIRCDQNRGPSEARDLGVAKATSDWVGFIDADDLWLPGRIQKAREVLQHFPDAKWIGGRYKSLFPDGDSQSSPSIICQVAAEPVADSLYRLSGPDLVRALIGDTWFHLGAHLVSRTAIQAVHGFGKRLFFHEDCLLFTKLATSFNLCYMDQDVYVWRRWPQSVLMHNPVRLGNIYVRKYWVALRHPLLRKYRRECWWALCGAYKGQARNNLLSGNRLRALRFAFQAWTFDPREIREFLRFVDLMRRPAHEAEELSLTYSRAEKFVDEQPLKGGRSE